MRKVDIITMGCSKNLVDSEQLLNLFAAQGFQIFHNPEETHGEIAVVNTCGFITSAKEESIQMILNLCELKEKGELTHVFVMGCLSERYLQELKEEIPQVDKFYGKFNWKELVSDLGGTFKTAVPKMGRILTTPKHYAYLKISEGCNRKCAYCAIPIITGRHKSRPMEEVLEEAKALAAQGVKEIQVIAQDLSYYGLDLYREMKLDELVERLSAIEGLKWIRLHYAYPAHFPWGVLRVMREKENVCNYLDIALQHISDHMLMRMQRQISKAETLELLEKIRREVPGIALRTTLMVGFPGETEEDFEELLEFVKQARFERMGAFAYSEEEGTYAAEHYEDDVPEKVKQNRLDRLMALQEEIASELSARKVGKKLLVMIDRREGNYFVGRTEHDSPEVDCEVLIPADNDLRLKIGEFYSVDITAAEEFDLYGRVGTPFPKP